MKQVSGALQALFSRRRVGWSHEPDLAPPPRAYPDRPDSLHESRRLHRGPGALIARSPEPIQAAAVVRSGGHGLDGRSSRQLPDGGHRMSHQADLLDVGRPEYQREPVATPGARTSEALRASARVEGRVLDEPTLEVSDGQSV